MSELIELGGQEVVGVSRDRRPNPGGRKRRSHRLRRSRGSHRLTRAACAWARALEVGEGMAVVEVFAGTTGLSIDGTNVRFLGGPCTSRWPKKCWGVSSTAWAAPLDGGPQPLTDHYADVNGQPINPTARVYPRDYHPDRHLRHRRHEYPACMGQKLPLFSGAGIPHDQLAAQIVRQATLGAPVGRDPRRNTSSLPSCLPPWASNTTWPISSATRLPKAAP